MEVLLDSFVRSRHYVPSGARRIRSPEELPLSLQRLTQQGGTVVWGAWGGGTRIWFVTAKPVHREHVGLLVMFFDMDGRLASAGVWNQVENRWVLPILRLQYRRIW